MNRTELVKAVAQRAGTTQDTASSVLEAFADTLIDAARRSEKVAIPGVLSLEVVDRAPRTGRNPRTGEELKIPASKGVKLSAGSALKAAVKR